MKLVSVRELLLMVFANHRVVSLIFTGASYIILTTMTMNNRSFDVKNRLNKPEKWGMTKKFYHIVGKK